MRQRIADRAPQQQVPIRHDLAVGESIEREPGRAQVEELGRGALVDQLFILERDLDLAGSLNPMLARLAADGEQVFIDHGLIKGYVLQLAAHVGEAEIDILDALVLDALENVRRERPRVCAAPVG